MKKRDEIDNFQKALAKLFQKRFSREKKEVKNNF